MPTDVKTRAILALTRRVNATGRDLDAARLLSKCTLKMRAVESRGIGGALGNPAADVTVHADHETLIESRRTGAADRIRRAVRDALADTPLHRLQWVEAAPARAVTGARRPPAPTAARPRFDRQGAQRAAAARAAATEARPAVRADTKVR